MRYEKVAKHDLMTAVNRFEAMEARETVRKNTQKTRKPTALSPAASIRIFLRL